MIDQKKIDRMRDVFDSLHDSESFDIRIYESSNKTWGATIGNRYKGEGDDVETAILFAEQELWSIAAKNLADKQEKVDSLRRTIEGCKL